MACCGPCKWASQETTTSQPQLQCTLQVPSYSNYCYNIRCISHTCSAYTLSGLQSPFPLRFSWEDFNYCWLLLFQDCWHFFLATDTDRAFTCKYLQHLVCCFLSTCLFKPSTSNHAFIHLITKATWPVMQPQRWSVRVCVEGACLHRCSFILGFFSERKCKHRPQAKLSASGAAALRPRLSHSRGVRSRWRSRYGVTEKCLWGKGWLDLIIISLISPVLRNYISLLWH